MSNVLTFVQAHWLGLFTAWMFLNIFLSHVAEAVPPTSKLAKALHVWVAINPMDLMKAIKAIGAEVTPPMGGAMLVLLGALALGSTGCGGAPAASPSVDPRAIANATTSLLEKAWTASGEACLDAANAAHDDTIRQKCEPPLTKTRLALLSAQSAVDTWDAAAQKNFPCLIGAVIEDFTAYTALGGPAPQALVDGISLARSYAGQCVVAAAGVQ